MSVDIATLGIKVDAASAGDAEKSLDNLANAGGRAETASKKLTSASQEMANSVGNAASSAKEASNATQSYENRVGNLMAAVFPTTDAFLKLNLQLQEAQNLYAAGALSANEFAGVQSTLEYETSKLVKAQVDASSKVTDFKNGTEEAGKASGLAASKAGELATNLAQLAQGDFSLTNIRQVMIGITEATAASGGAARGAAAAFKSLAASIYAALAPFLPLLLGIAAAVGLVVGAFAIGTREINKNVGDVTKGMGLTEKQLDRLKDKGTETSVTLSDTFKAFFQVIGSRLATAFAGPLKSVKDAFETAYSFIRDKGYAAIKAIVGGFVGGLYAIKAAWQVLPGAIGDVAVTAANFVISAVETMINKVVGGINDITAYANAAAVAVGLAAPFGNLSPVKFERMASDGSAKRAGQAVGKAMAEGYAVGSASVDNFAKDVGSQARKNAEGRIRTDAGDPDKTKASGGKSDAQNEYEKQLKASQDYLEGLKKETDEIGKNRIELKMSTIEREAAKAPTKALAAAIRESGEAWKKATNAEATKKLREELQKTNDQIAFENTLLGMNAEQRAKATTQREYDLKIQALTKEGYTIEAETLRDLTNAVVENAGAKGKLKDQADSAANYADHIASLADNIRDASGGLEYFFGTAGAGFENLINVVADYGSKSADIEANLAAARERAAGNIIELQRAEGQASSQRAKLEVQNTMAMLGAAKTLFKEKSIGYKVIEAAEKAYRLFQFAMSVKAMLMDTAETGSSVAKSGIRTAAHAVEAVVKAISSSTFPLNLVAGAATAAAIAALGVKIFGGGGGGGGASVADTPTVSKPTQVYTGAYDEYGKPTSDYSVLKRGQVSVGGANDNMNYNNPASGSNFSNSFGGVSIGGSTLIVQGNLDSDIIPQVQQMLDNNNKQVVQQSREAVAKDNAAANSRQRIGGSN